MLPWIFKFALRDLCIIPFPQREFSPDSNSVFEINGTNLRRIWGCGIWIISYLCQRTSAIPCFGKDTDFPWKEPILLTFFTEGKGIIPFEDVPCVSNVEMIVLFTIAYHYLMIAISLQNVKCTRRE